MDDQEQSHAACLKMLSQMHKYMSDKLSLEMMTGFKEIIDAFIERLSRQLNQANQNIQENAEFVHQLQVELELVKKKIPAS